MQVYDTHCHIGLDAPTRLAEVRGLSLEDAAELTYENAIRLLG